METVKTTDTDDAMAREIIQAARTFQPTALPVICVDRPRRKEGGDLGLRRSGTSNPAHQRGDQELRGEGELATAQERLHVSWQAAVLIVFIIMAIWIKRIDN